jgi:PIN domain nuclease of toxin-antitoxin system
MRVLLDTHVLLWVLSTPERLSGEAIRAIHEAESVLFSAASIWEIAIKARLGYRDFLVQPLEIFTEARDIGFIELPVHSAVVATVGTLPLLHRDPFDRLLIAQATAEPAVLFTADRQLTAYSDLVKQVGAR